MAVSAFETYSAGMEQRAGGAQGPSPVIALNDRWRVRLNDPLQWILERRQGRQSARRTGWVGSSFCATRRALIRNIREDCGEVDPEALCQVEALPEMFSYPRQNLDDLRSGVP